MDVLLRIGIGLLMFLHWIYVCFKSWTLEKEDKKSVIPSDDRLLNISALSLAQKIRERKILSKEVVQLYIKRIKEVNPIINAVVEDRFEAAIAEAEAIDRYLDDNDHKVDELVVTKPLLGVPITVKEAIAVKGLSYTGGTLVRKNIKADKDSVVVQHLKEAGIIPLLVSNTPEYCTSLATYNKIIGYTYNPYNTRYTSGGSSGGEGALLGAGASVMGIGSDIAGSIRLPAMFNGIFGHKPTSKIVSLEGHWPTSDDEIFQSSLVIGPLTRYAEDLKPLLKILSGPNAESLKLDEKIDLSKIVVFYMEDIGNTCLCTTDENIKIAIKTAAAYLSKEYHCHIGSHKFEDLADSIEMAIINLTRIEKIPTPVKDTEIKYNLGFEIIKELFGKSIFTIQHLLCVFIYNIRNYIAFNPEKYVHKLKKLRNEFETVLGNNGVLILPCMPTSATLPGDSFVSLPSSSYVAIVNSLGLPATAVPTGFDSCKMPIGIQVIAGPRQDKLTIAVAQELEKCFGGWQAVP